MPEIKNIVFDFGGVLIDLDVTRTFNAMSGVLEMDVNKELFHQHKGLFEDYEGGQISTETFLWRFQYMSKKVPNAAEVIRAWNAMIVGWNPEKLKFLNEISQKYNTFLLSNTNEVHLQWIRRDLKNNHNISDFDSRFFKKTYYSHLLRMRKPNAEIFEFVLRDAGIEKSETVFIDDMIENIEVAKNLGLHTILHETNAALSEEYILSNLS